ncbi:MAG: phosphate acyltransferase PlsX [Actinobacteria bacterium]|nr:phosphate acyltransferase PlsX [Actinomycetota bacterium]
MKLAVDAMGGDRAPAEVVRGVCEALEFLQDDTIVLVGREPDIMEHLAGSNGWQGRIEILHADEVIGMGDSPINSIRQKKDSSLNRLVELGATGQADAVISAGNTGAYVAACQLGMRTLPGVLRPGIAVAIPRPQGVSVVADVGANVACRPQHLYQYAVMASVYYEKLFHKKNPRVGLISVGEEASKGNQLVREAYELCQADSAMNFLGNIEGRDIFSGSCEVMICEGFVGNVLLKVVESLVGNLMDTVQSLAQKQIPEAAAGLVPITREIQSSYDYSLYGGAPLLGLQGLSIKCHGSSGSQAITNAIRTARNLAYDHLNEQIVERLNR